MKIIKIISRSIKRWLSGNPDLDRIAFTCNICGARNDEELSNLSREVPSCTKCGSTVRMRAVIHVLSMELFNKSMVLKDFPLRKDIYGIGMSDWEGYASRLAQKLDYTNTFYHQEPMLDITNPPAEMDGALDFVISTDVFEHVLYPVSRAFDNTSRLLKSTGVFVFTVPYTKEGDETVEHFGRLNNFEVIKTGGEFVLNDVDEYGNERQFDNLVFHGGPGTTLEMRVFSEHSLMQELNNSGFNNIKVYGQPYLEYGILWNVDWSLPIAARM